MTIRFDERAVIVTGAGAGLGRAYALDLARRGAQVVVNDLGTSVYGDGSSGGAADDTVREIVEAGGQAVASYDSVATDQGCRNMTDLALESFGRIDAVVHNAGIVRNVTFDDMADDQWFPVLETHLLGGFFLSRAVWATMRSQGYGRIVLTSSSSGAFGRTHGANYASAKAGLLGLCNALALEGEEHGIFANAILPNARTRMSDSPDREHAHLPDGQRPVDLIPRFEVEGVVPMVSYLASEACERTHEYFSTAGGRYARVFVGAAVGWRPEEETPPGAEEIAAHIDEITALDEFDVPATGGHEIKAVIARHGLSDPGFF